MPKKIRISILIFACLLAMVLVLQSPFWRNFILQNLLYAMVTFAIAAIYGLYLRDVVFQNSVIKRFYWIVYFLTLEFFFLKIIQVNILHQFDLYFSERIDNFFSNKLISSLIVWFLAVQLSAFFITVKWRITHIWLWLYYIYLNLIFYLINPIFYRGN